LPQQADRSKLLISKTVHHSKYQPNPPRESRGTFIVPTPGEPLSDAVVFSELRRLFPSRFPTGENRTGWKFPYFLGLLRETTTLMLCFWVLRKNLWSRWTADSDLKRSLLNRAKASKASTSASTPLELFQGSVYDDNGKPIVGVMVTAAHAEYRLDGARHLALATAVLLMMTGIFISLAYDLGLITSALARKAEHPEHRFSYQPQYYPNVSLLDDAQRVPSHIGNRTIRDSIWGVKSEPTYTISGKIIAPPAQTRERRYGRDNQSFRRPAKLVQPKRKLCRDRVLHSMVFPLGNTS